MPDNLGPLCRHHHLLRHASPSHAQAPPRLAQPEAGRFVWTTPTGHQHGVDPPALLEPDDPLAALDTAPDLSLVPFALHHERKGFAAGRRAAQGGARRMRDLS